MRKLNPEDLTLLEGLRDRILLVLDFVERHQGFPYGSGIRTAVAKAADEGSLRGMRLLAREIDKMTIGLEPQQRDGLEAVLKAGLGIDKEAEWAELRQRMAAVVRRGTIASEKERRRLEDYAELLEAEGRDSTDLAAVRKLLKSD